jgi:hypothetical protein
MILICNSEEEIVYDMSAYLDTFVLFDSVLSSHLLTTSQETQYLSTYVQNTFPPSDSECAITK